MDVEKIYLEIFEEELTWANLNNGYDGVAHLLEPVDHPGKRHLEKVIGSYTPDELKKLEEVKKDVRELTTLRVNISDLKKIGKLIDRLEIVTEENCRLKQIETKFKEAEEAYHSNPGARKDRQAVKAVQILGWSTGTRPKRVPKRKIFNEYMSLIKNKTPMDKWEALKLLAEKYELASKEAALSHVQDVIEQFKDAHKLLNSNWYTSHTVKKINSDKYAGVLPPNWPS